MSRTLAPSQARSRALRALYWLAALVLLAACSGREGRLPALDADATILAFGDSLTYGSGASPREGYPQQLQELIGHRVINAGVPGETTAQGRQRLPAVVEREAPDLIILCLGGNDFLRRLNEQAARDNLAAMIESIQARNIPLVLMAVPELRLLGGNNPMYRELAGHYDLVLEDGIMLEVLRNRALKSDPIHPNAQGYRRIAEALAELLREAGAVR